MGCYEDEMVVCTHDAVRQLVNQRLGLIPRVVPRKSGFCLSEDSWYKVAGEC